MQRPFVYVNMATTVDGKITSATREYPRFTSSEDRRRMDRLRSEADALLIGAGTVRADDPPLRLRDPDAIARRKALGKPPELLRVVVTGRGDLDPGARFFREAGKDGTIVATAESVPVDRIRPLRERAEIWHIGSDRVDLGRLLDRLSQRGVERLLVEGGGELNWQLVAGGLVDELFVTIAPRLLGGRDAPSLLEGEGFAMHEQRELRLLDVDRQGDELFCRYALE